MNEDREQNDRTMSNQNYEGKNRRRGNKKEQMNSKGLEAVSKPSSPPVFRFGRDGLRLIVRIFRGARTDYAREGEDRTDNRGL